MNKDRDRWLKSLTLEVSCVVSCNRGVGDNVTRGQELVRAALGGCPGMKWITHVVAQRETKCDGQNHSCAGM